MSNRNNDIESETSSSESSDCCNFDFDDSDYGYNSDVCEDIGNKRKAQLKMKKFKNNDETVSEAVENKEWITKEDKNEIKDLMSKILPKCKYVFKSGKKKGQECGRTNCRTKTHR